MISYIEMRNPWKSWHLSRNISERPYTPSLLWEGILALLGRDWVNSAHFNTFLRSMLCGG